MRVKTFCAFCLATTFLIGCTEDKIEINTAVFERSEISFTADKPNLSFASQVLGITSFKGGVMEQANRFIFLLQAQKSVVNGRTLDFNDVKVSITKVGLKKYEVTANLEGIGFTKLSSDLSNNSTTLDVGKKSFVAEQLSDLKNEDHIALITMSSILNDIVADRPFLNISNSSAARIQCGYYGYTIGWGWTQDQAVDHESCVRDSACENIQRYSCEYLGSSTSCGFGAIGCVTISTFRCDDGKACN